MNKIPGLAFLFSFVGLLSTIFLFIVCAYFPSPKDDTVIFVWIFVSIISSVIGLLLGSGRKNTLSKTGFYLGLITVIFIVLSMVDVVPPYSKSMSNIRSCKRSIIQYAHKNNMLPVSLNELKEPNIIKDVWGNPIKYSFDNDYIVTLSSLGKDNKKGGEGNNRDIIDTFQTKYPCSKSHPNGYWAVDDAEWIEYPSFKEDLILNQNSKHCNISNKSTLSGILKKTVNSFSPYMLLLDGSTENVYLRGEILKVIPEGQRVLVKGLLRSELNLLSQDKPSPSGWHIFMDVDNYKIISEPFNEDRK